MFRAAVVACVIVAALAASSSICHRASTESLCAGLSAEDCMWCVARERGLILWAGVRRQPSRWPVAFCRRAAAAIPVPPRRCVWFCGRPGSARGEGQRGGARHVPILC